MDECKNETNKAIAAARVQAVLDCTAEGIWGLGLNGDITFINRQALKMFGYAHEDEVIGKNSHALFHHSRADGSKYPREACPIFQAMPAGAEVHLENDTFWRADGTSFVGEYRSKPLYVMGKLDGAVVTFLDVTERMDRKREFIDVLESMNDAYFSVDKNWMILSVNRQHEMVTKLKREEQIGKNFLQLFLPKVSDRSTNYFLKYTEAMEGRIPVHFEDYYAPLNLWTAVHAYPKADGGLAVFFTDITAQKNSELRLASEKKKLDYIFQESPAAMTLWRGPEFIFELVNPLYQALFPGRILQGLPFIKALPEFEGTPFIDLLRKVFETGETVVGREMLARHRPFPDAPLEDRYYDFSYIQIKSDDGSPYGVYNHAIDVTERVLSRKQIEQSEIQFGLLANSIPQLAWMARADGYIYWYNQNWYHYTGTTPAQMEGWGWQSVHDPKILPEVMVSWPKSIQTGEPFSMEFPIRDRHGNFYWFLTRAAPVKDADGTIIGWIGSNTNIDEQKKLITDLEKEKEIRERFVTALTHDLRTPMTSAKMSAQVLGRREFTLPEIKKISERISASMDRAESMIKNLLDANRLKAGDGIPLTFAPTVMKAVVESAVTDLINVYGPRFEFKNELENSPGFWDADGIRRMIENLGANAIKYGASDTLVSLRLSSPAPSEVEITVHNWGNPIPAEDQSTLFSVYHRTDSALLSGQKGWGIGLALVKGVAEGHGGLATVKSNLAEGTTFSVRLPLDSRKNHD